jgi:hypothetical protein
MKGGTLTNKRSPSDSLSTKAGQLQDTDTVVTWIGDKDQSCPGIYRDRSISRTLGPPPH